MATLCSTSALSRTHVHTQTSHWWCMLVADGTGDTGQVTLLPAWVRAGLCLPWLSVSSNNPTGTLIAGVSAFRKLSGYALS